SKYHRTTRRAVIPWSLPPRPSAPEVFSLLRPGQSLHQAPRAKRNSAIGIVNGPAGPVAPVAPVAPTAPFVPFVPAAPVAPVGPVAPTAPFVPFVPAAPVPPVAPAGPVAPTSPVRENSKRISSPLANGLAALDETSVTAN